MALLLIAGSVGLIVTRGRSNPPPDSPAHFAHSLAALPAVAQQAASRAVLLSISTPGHAESVPALVVRDNLAVTTTRIPVNAIITGTTSSQVNFPVRLVGRDNLTGFSIVRLSRHIASPPLGPLPANTAVTVLATIEQTSTTPADFAWASTTLGDPTVDSMGIVRYLAVSSQSSLANVVDSVAIDAQGRVVAVQSSQHRWFSATFVAQVAHVVATGRGCHAWLGIAGHSEQGGGVHITKVARYSAASHAGLVSGDVLTKINGNSLETWPTFASLMYLTPAYTSVTLQWDHGTKVHSSVVTVGCDI